MKQVIRNADDFGKSMERNRAIDDSFKLGLIDSAGLIVTGKYLPDAIKYIKEGKYADRIHLHINLSANRLYEGSEDIPLTETMRNDSFFCTNGAFTLYKGLPHRFSDIKKWRIVYCELVAQYKRFIEITNGEADYSRIDFHLWYNLTWPVSVALNLFTWKYNIKSVRYIGLHQLKNKRFRLYRILSWNPRTKHVPATNIDYYLTNRKQFANFKVIELYCHPNYKEGVFLDDSPSYLKHERRPMLEQMRNLKDSGEMRFVSWGNAI